MAAMGQATRDLAFAAVVSRGRETQVEVAERRAAAAERARAVAEARAAAAEARAAAAEANRDAMVNAERALAERDGRDANAVILALRRRIAELEEAAGRRTYHTI